MIVYKYNINKNDIIHIKISSTDYGKKVFLRNRFGHIIKRFRIVNNLSQNDLAYLLNIKRQSVSKWERGLSLPSSYMFVEIIDLFIDYNFYEEIEKIDNKLNKRKFKLWRY